MNNWKPDASFMRGPHQVAEGTTVRVFRGPW